MKNKWLYLMSCFIAPHVMFAVGIVFISQKDLEHRTFGLRLCRYSTTVLIAGSLVYYIVFTPIMGID